VVNGFLQILLAKKCLACSTQLLNTFQQPVENCLKIDYVASQRGECSSKDCLFVMHLMTLLVWQPAVA